MSPLGAMASGRDNVNFHRKSIRWTQERLAQRKTQPLPSPETSENGWYRCQHSAENILQSKCFNTVMNCIVFCNAVTIGADQSMRLVGDHNVFLDRLEHLFITAFLFELCVHAVATGWRTLTKGWVLMDTCVVGAAIFVSWIAPLLRTLITNVDSFGFLMVVTVLRIARLARLVRAVRFVRLFSQLWLLVHAFTGSLRTVVYTLVVLLVVLFTYSAAAMEVITLRYKDEPTPAEIMDIVDEFFPNFGMTMLTLMQVTTLDSVAQIYRPLIAYDWVLVFYFVSAILVISVVFMNIITAIIVETALEQSNNDKDMKFFQEQERKAELMDSLYMMFLHLDKDHSGNLFLDELLAASPEDLEVLSEFCGDMDIKEVFNVLDVNGCGAVDICDFCEGLYRTGMDGTPLELRHIVMQMQRIEGKLEELNTNMRCPPPRDDRWSSCDRGEQAVESSLVKTTGCLEEMGDRSMLPDVHSDLLTGGRTSMASHDSGTPWDRHSSNRQCGLLRRSQAALEELHEHWRQAMQYNLEAQSLSEECLQLSRWCKGKKDMAGKTDSLIREVVAATREEIRGPVEDPGSSSSTLCRSRSPPPTADLGVQSSAPKDPPDRCQPKAGASR